MQLEKIGSTSPLLSDAVIERDYTKNIEGQLNGQNGQTQQQSQPQPPVDDPFEETGSAGQQDQQQQYQQPGPGGDFDGPKGFAFKEEIEGDPSDTEDGDDGPFAMASGSATTIANVIGDLIKIKVPDMTFKYCKVDLGNIEMHINSGNIAPSLREPFQQINAATHEALEYSDDEIKMWKKAFKKYLEYKKIKAANDETAFYIASGTMALTTVINMRALKKQNEQYIIHAINSYNPGYFEGFAAKTGKAPEAEPTKAEPEKESTKTDKTQI